MCNHPYWVYFIYLYVIFKRDKLFVNSVYGHPVMEIAMASSLFYRFEISFHFNHFLVILHLLISHMFYTCLLPLKKRNSVTLVTFSSFFIQHFILLKLFYAQLRESNGNEIIFYTFLFPQCDRSYKGNVWGLE